MNPARIDGGGPNNVVPDNAVLRWNMRPRSAAAQLRAEAGINEIVAAVASAHDVHIHVHGSFARPPFKPNAGLSPALAAMLAERLWCASEPAPSALPFASS